MVSHQSYALICGCSLGRDWHSPVTHMWSLNLARGPYKRHLILVQARTGQQVLWGHPRHAARDGQRHCKDLQTEEALNSGNRPHDTYREGRKGDPKVDVQVRLRSAID